MTVRKTGAVAARAGFTLMEVLVVVAILIVLAGAAVPIYLSYLEDSRIERAKLDVKSLEGAVDAFNTKYGDYPGDLSPLFNPPEPGSRAALPPEAQFDPWQQPYIYSYNERHPTTGRPRIYSAGPPGKNQPIANW